MRYFFIDLENVRNEGLEGVLSLTETDMVYIFYSENAFSMAIPTLESITNSKCTSKFIKTNYIGKNAMDFQIVSLFGAMIERCRSGSFYIISKDNGFRSAVSFCESFFADYKIKAGVYPRIIAAIAAESKNTRPESKKQNQDKEQVKNKNTEPTPKAETPVRTVPEPEQPEQSDENETDRSEKSGRKRNRSRSRKKKNTAGNEAVMNQPAEAATEEVSTQTASEDTGEATGTVEAKPSGRRNRNRKKNKSVQETAEAEKPADVQNIPDTSAGSDEEGTVRSGKQAYIYEILGEFLSERTIEMYAGLIDEGIAKTANKEELETFFRDSLGDDEGEALYKVIRSDYEKYKQSRPKRPSRPRRHRPKK